MLLVTKFENDSGLGIIGQEKSKDCFIGMVKEEDNSGLRIEKEVRKQSHQMLIMILTFP